MRVLRFKGHILATILTQISYLLPFALSVDPDCDYYQDVVRDQIYYVYNPGYPNNYKRENSCRWIARSPENTKMELKCEVDMPPSHDCNQDELVVSTSGSPTLSDGYCYCGKGTFSIKSDSNQLSVDFTSALNSSGGKFLCTLQTIDLDYSECECGWHNLKRIVGGEDTLVNEYPMMAGIVEYGKSNGIGVNLFCGSTIISPNYVVTAAHCLINRDVSHILVVVGEWDISTGADSNATKVHRAERFIIHNQYNTSILGNDIGLVKTQTEIIYTPEVGPVCLPLMYRTANFEGTSVTALGWGTLKFGGARSGILQKVNLTWISQKKCEQIYSLLTNQFCTFSRGKDTCQFDSGGPVLWQDVLSSRIQLLGIISYGMSCGEQPGVNTKVTDYIDWIYSQTPGEQYCAKL